MWQDGKRHARFWSILQLNAHKAHAKNNDPLSPASNPPRNDGVEASDRNTSQPAANSLPGPGEKYFLNCNPADTIRGSFMGRDRDVDIMAESLSALCLNLQPVTTYKGHRKTSERQKYRAIYGWKKGPCVSPNTSPNWVPLWFRYNRHIRWDAICKELCSSKYAFMANPYLCYI